MAKGAPHILIVGGGLGGLLLSQTLRKNKISFEVFERDCSDNIRVQGWAIGLHTMLDELDTSIPDDMPSRDFVNHLLPLKYNYECAWYRHDRTRKLGVRDDGSGKFIRANRARLRKWLATNVPIRYGKHAVRIEEHDDLVTVHFEDGTSATGDILIGADGPYSPTRKYLLGGQDVIRHPRQGIINGEVILHGRDMEQQLQMGASCYLVDASLTDESPSFLFVGLSEVFPDGKSGRYFFNLFWRDEAATRKGFWTYSASSEKLYETALEKTKHLPPKFRSIIEKTGPEGMKNPPLRFYTLIMDPDLLPKGRITLLGDAAHCMPSFRGEGGFHALLDALELGKVLAGLRTNSTDEIKRALGDYQDEMLDRGSKAAAWSTIAFDEAWSGDDAGPRIIWGLPVVPLPDEKITL
ncbi:putative monooxygenase [Daldinia caldariorum]|uniref:putative monooxygenase n=1 Tax=Daldinia caldariorum TaxID=326644 RepID=UPI0020084A45|nr:putative monooxygenase [Daldinia caldariorum]KAI1466581.1 putative monooxygenase [Daldinia caldariorum]